MIAGLVSGKNLCFIRVFPWPIIFSPQNDANKNLILVKMTIPEISVSKE